MMAYYSDLVNKADDAGMPDEVLENTKAFSDKVFAAIMDGRRKIIMRRRVLQANTL
jgi:hypothetical protein